RRVRTTYVGERTASAMLSQDRILDQYLVAAARAGDRTAFEALARRWEKPLVGHAWRLVGDAELARDVAQSAWLDIAAALPRLDDCAAFPAFAFRITTRRAADAIRRARRRRGGEAAFAVEPRAEYSSADSVEAAPDATAVAAAMNRLPRDQRAAIALFYLEDLSVAEIAAALDVPAGTVKTRLMAAREKLRSALGVRQEKQHEQTRQAD
ncbi:MAG: sigma-70 family RNA polymerase sigma factor, partial [Parvularculaceae bacterium]|nr:sigma-70 family RNA polymerase sigma factor [Parvularculaceae bacterium]